MLATIFRRLPSAAVTLLLFPVIAADYFNAETGRDHKVGMRRKLILLYRMIRNNFRITSASSFITHVLMATEVLKIPKSTPGVLVECGAFKGGSTANLSLVAAAVGRELHVFDSFAGLPKPDHADEGHVLLGSQEVRTYHEGAYSGSLAEVQQNVARFGAPASCTYHVGFFEETLPNFAEPIVFAYLDVDLVKSEETCVKHLWPLLGSDCFLFTDEAHHHEIAKLFYDSRWWQDVLGEEAPGLVGGGSGIGLFLHPGGFRSGLGYTVKVDRSTLPVSPG